MPVTCSTRPATGEGISAVIQHRGVQRRQGYRRASYNNIPFPCPSEVCEPSASFIKMVDEITLSEQTRKRIGYHRMRVMSIHSRTLMRPGMASTKSNILVLIVEHERNEVLARRTKTDVPFVAELQHQECWGPVDAWDFLPGNIESTKGIMAVKDIFKAKVSKCIPTELRNGIVYRLINRACAPIGPHEPAVTVLVKPNSHLKWHEVEKQVKDAIKQARGGKDTMIYLEFGAGNKPVTTAADAMKQLTQHFLGKKLNLPSQTAGATPLVHPSMMAEALRRLQTAMNNAIVGKF